MDRQEQNLRVGDHMRLEQHLVHLPVFDAKRLRWWKVQRPIDQVSISVGNDRIVREHNWLKF